MRFDLMLGTAGRRQYASFQEKYHLYMRFDLMLGTAGCRQYASFQDKYHLYMLFDLMLGGDLMDVLVAEAKVIKRREAQGGWKRGCLAPKVIHLVVMVLLFTRWAGCPLRGTRLDVKA